MWKLLLLLVLLSSSCTHYKPDGSVDWNKEISDFSIDNAGQWPWK